MDLSRQALAPRLETQIDPRYFIYGKESFLSERSADLIRAAARKAGYEERIALAVEKDFDWSILNQHMMSLSMFSQKKIIEIRLLTDRIGTAGSEALVQCMQVADPDTVVMLLPGAVDTTVARTKWYKAWRAGAVAVDNRPLFPNQFRDWIRNVLERRNIRFEREAVDRLAYLFEGNMLAAANEMQKIAMGYGGEVLSASQIELVVADQGQFSIYALGDACVAGQGARALRLLRSLRNEGQDPILILWVFAREVRTICACAEKVASGNSVRGAMEQMGVWKSKHNSVEKAVRRHGLAGSERIVGRIARADRILKGQSTASGGDIWNELERIALQICGVPQIGT